MERPPAATVQIPLPVLGAFASIERSYFDLCIRAGPQVLAAMMEQDRTELCGPRWKRDPDRRAGRAGTAPSEVTLGGRRIQMTRPRVRSQAGQEVELPSFAFAAHRDPLDAPAVNAVACGISTRKYARSLDTLPDEVAERSTSKRAVSRRYVAMRRWCADSARWASSGRHVDHRGRAITFERDGLYTNPQFSSVAGLVLSTGRTRAGSPAKIRTWAAAHEAHVTTFHSANARVRSAR